MLEVTSCVICDAPIHKLKRALVAPFVAQRTWKRKPFCVDLVRCKSCTFMFYNPRLDDEDLKNLYDGYRSDEFQRIRFETELFRPAALYMMHMHINYFSEHSLKVLMQKSGGEVIATGTYPFTSRAGKADMAWCIAEKS